MDLNVLRWQDDPYWDVEYGERRKEYDNWLALDADSAREPTADDFLVDGLIVHESVTILASPPKSGKTSFATALALAVADGADFIGRKVKHGPVLWLSLEESRFERGDLMRFAQPNPGRPLHVGYWWPPLNGDVAEDALEYWLGLTRATLVVVDPLAAAVTAGTLQDGPSARALVARYRRVARNLRTSFLFIHHLTKAQIARPEPRAFADSIQLLAAAGMIVHLTTTPAEPRGAIASTPDPLPDIATPTRGRAPDSLTQAARARMHPLDLADLDDPEMPSVNPTRHSFAVQALEDLKRVVAEERRLAATAPASPLPVLPDVQSIKPTVPRETEPRPQCPTSNAPNTPGLRVKLTYTGRGVWANGTLTLDNPSPLVYLPVAPKPAKPKAKEWILELLEAGPMWLKEIVDATGLAEGTVKNCLTALKRKGLVLVADLGDDMRRYTLNEQSSSPEIAR